MERFIAHPKAKERRDRNKDAGRCINENRRLEHGPATHGVLCEKCRMKHRKTQ